MMIFKLLKISTDWKGFHDGGSALLVNLHGCMWSYQY